MEEKKQYYCKTCNKTMGADQFYTSNDLSKYPQDGKLNECKQCITRHVNNWKPETYMWILQECDVPYIPEEWNALMARYCQDPKKVKGTTIVGRYLSKMKLNQFKEYRWKDSQFLQELQNKKIEETMKRSGYGAQEIAEAINKATVALPTEPLTKPEYAETGTIPNGYYEPNPQVEQVEDFLDLTDEDKTYLRLKWGKAYKPEEWVTLEQLYNDMMESYDIQSAGHIDTLKLVCKTSLKCNQLIDMGDIEGFQKAQKSYDSLMKSGNFTAAQNKADRGEFVDSVGEIIELCEKEGFITRFYVDKPNDKVDLTIQDMQRYTRTLIEEETNLTKMIEAQLKQIAKEDKEAAENQEDTIIDDIDDLSIEDIEKEIRDEDYSDFNDFLEDESTVDDYLLSKIAEGEME